MFEIYSLDEEEPPVNMSAFYRHKRFHSKNKNKKKNVIPKNNFFNLSEQMSNWDSLKLSIEDAIENLNPGNIRFTRNKLLQLNIVRARGLFCQAIINAQSASLHCTNMYATLASFINLEFPNVIELLLTRCIHMFTNAYKFKNENKYKPPILFISFMIYHNVAKECLAFDIIKKLIKSPTKLSLDMVEEILKICGEKINSNPQNKLDLKYTFDTLHKTSQDDQIDKSVQCLAARIALIAYQDYFEDEQQIDLVDPFKQYTHLMTLNCEYDPQYELDFFIYDVDYKSNEFIYKTNIKQVLKLKRKVWYFGKHDFDELADDEDEHEPEANNMLSFSRNIAIKKTINILVNSKLPPLEIAIELMQIKLKPGQEMELCLMYFDCCFEHNTIYNADFGIIIRHLCNVNGSFVGVLETYFIQCFSTIHHFSPNKLVNLAKFYAQLLHCDWISWKIFSTIRLTESETTNSSRAYLKNIFKDLIVHMGRDGLKERILDPYLQKSFSGFFPFNNHGNFRLCDNFFTDIGMEELIIQYRKTFQSVAV